MVVADNFGAKFSIAAALALAALGYISPADAATESVVYSFRNSDNDGNNPDARLVNIAGTLYGTTDQGGDSNNGTVFSIKPRTGIESVLYSFQSNGTDGSLPQAALTNLSGTLYSTTYNGGPYGLGTVFLITKTGVESVVHSFSGADGAGPQADLINIRGTLYGTTQHDGAGGAGTVFSINPMTGFQTLHSFSGSEGAAPTGALLNVGGTLYGTTNGGGTNGWGTVYSLELKNLAEKTLYNFRGGDGGEPNAALINVRGTFYSTTWQGGANGVGTVFSITKTGVERVVHSFNGTDGAYPAASLININGVLYGTTYYGGGTSCHDPYADGCGVVFSVNPKTNGYNVVYYFQNDGSDASRPYAPLINVGGTLYGTSSTGGANGVGTVFKLSIPREVLRQTPPS